MVVDNSQIIKQFDNLIEQIKYDMDHASTRGETMQQSMRLRAIITALDIIKKYPNTIKSGEEIQHIKGIGKGVVSRINEILKYGYLSEINKDKGIHKHLKYIEELEKIFGIGRKTATKLVINHNIKSINELKKAYNKGTIDLPSHIVLGLKYYGVYKEVIPRAEIINIDKVIQSVVNKIDKNLKCQICGSFRRGKPTSNDIDILLTNKINKININYLKLFVQKLKDIKLIIEDIDKEYEVKYMGFCKLNDNPVRRIDIMYVPYESYPTSLLHFTGSWEFNRKMRELAIELGYTLNQYGLYSVDNKNKKKTLIPTISEKDIFEKLGMEYIEPNLRG